MTRLGRRGIRRRHRARRRGGAGRGGSRIAACRRRTAGRPRRGHRPRPAGLRSTSPTPSFCERYDELVAPAREADAAAAPHRHRGVRPGDRRTSVPVCSSRDRRPSRCWNGLSAQPLVAAPGDRRPVHRLRRAGAGAVEALARRPRHRRRRLRRRAGLRPPKRRRHRRRTGAGRRHRRRRCSPELDGQVDLLVANPPYIPDGAALEPEVAEHDPPHALFGGPDGMAVIDAIVELAARLAACPAGAAPSSTTTPRRRATVEAFTRTGRFVDVTARRDLAGRPRFVTAVAERR